jgi:hypothetical protein
VPALGFAEKSFLFAQVAHLLGEDQYSRLLPGASAEKCIVWSKYRKQAFDQILRSQNRDGSWSTGRDPIHETALNLSILQLEKGALPIYQR